MSRAGINALNLKEWFRGRSKNVLKACETKADLIVEYSIRLMQRHNVLRRLKFYKEAEKRTELYS